MNGLMKRNGSDVSALVYGKVPPQAVELEEAVLGALMLDRSKYDEVSRIIRSPECFYTDANQKVYAAIMSLSAKGSAVDLLTVTDQLRKSDNLEAIGGAYHLTKLTFNVTSTAHIADHARIVMEKFIDRETIRICGEAIARAYSGTEDVFKTLETAQVDLSGVIDHIRSGNIKRLGDALIPTVMAMKEASMNPSELIGLPTGLSKLDRITLGLNSPDLIVVAAGTGEGKTTLALNIAEHIASEDIPIGFFSLEMKDRQLIWKMLSSHLKEDIRSIRSGKISSANWNKLEHVTMPLLSDFPFYLYDVGGLNIIELKAIVRTMVKKYKIKAAFIDYIQLVRGAGRKFGSREEEVNFVSKELKALAMELEIPIIALSQLNRIEKQNAKRMYRLSDLRESGAIEQDADMIIFIYRPVEHEQTEMNVGGTQMRFVDTDALIDIAKCRLGQTGTFRVRFDGAFNKFSDYEPQLEFGGKLSTPGNYRPATSEESKAIHSEPADDDADGLPF